MDDDGVMHVFEALLVGVLVLTAILFMTALSAPSQSESSGGLDLARIAADTLDILEGRDAECDADDPTPPGACTTLYEHRLEEIVSLAMEGKHDEAESFLREVLPSGTRFLLRLDNGVEPMTLMPTGAGLSAIPRNAQGAETFLLPDWSTHAADPDPATAFYRHGDAVNFAGWTLTAPNGATTAPNGASWNAWWTSLEPAQDRIPSSVPFGLWETGSGLIRIHGDAMTDHPMYAVQLLVWPGA